MARSMATKTGPRQIASAETTVRILAMRQVMTLQQIADIEHLSHRAVRARIEKALKDAPSDAVALLRTTQTEQILYAMRAIAERVGRGELAAIDRWFHGLERMARLHGLDLTPELHIHPPLPQSTLTLLESWGNSVEGSYKLLEEPQNEPDST